MIRESAPGRRQSIDLLRIVAAFGIVWAHMQAPGMAEGYVALALFLILTSFLSLRSLTRAGGGRRAGRLARLALPWAVWSAAFLAVEALRFGWRDALTLDDPLAWLVGPSIHLWFLPFALLASPLVVLAHGALTSGARVWAAALLLVPAAAGAMALHDAGGLPAPLAQWAFALTPFLYGLLSAAGQRHGAVGAGLAFALGAMTIAEVGWDSPMAPFVLGAALLFEAAWRLRLPGSAWSTLGALAFGVYLSHPLFMLVWYRLAGGASPALGAVAVFAMSLAAVWAIRRLPGGRLVA